MAPGCALAAPRSSAGHRSPPLFPLIHRVSGALLCAVPQLRSGCITSLQLRLRVGKVPAALVAYSAGCHPSLPRTAGVGGPELCPASPQIHQSKVVVSNPERYICSPFPSVSVIRRASSSGELRCLVRERCIALPGRGLTFCHGNVAWVNRLERPETVRLPLAFAFWSTSWAPCHSPCPRSQAAHRRCVRTRGPHHLSPHPRDGGDPRFSPDA